MIKTHLWGILNAIILHANNGGAKSINARIKLIRCSAADSTTRIASATPFTSISVTWIYIQRLPRSRNHPHDLR
ncbi:MAG: transposase [Pseudomonadota bacterium]|nr:transposase [Pseudomonadota bacterium]